MTSLVNQNSFANISCNTKQYGNHTSKFLRLLIVCAGLAFEYIILLIPAKHSRLHEYHMIFTCLYKVA